MTSDFASIAATLAAIREENAELLSQQAEILSLLRRVMNPASTLSAQEKASAILAAERSGDKRRVKDVLRQINKH
jgi:hypothetical protein